MKTENIKIGDLIEFKYTTTNQDEKWGNPIIEDITVKGLVTNIENQRKTFTAFNKGTTTKHSNGIPSGFAIFTIRDEDKNSPTYFQYIKYEEEKMTNIHEVLELSKPLTDREKEIINFYENHISDIYSTVEDELQTARGLIDELSYQITSVENEVVGDMQERLIEHLEEQEADERRKSIQDIVGKE